MEFDHSKLAGRVKEKFKSQEGLAEFLGWPPSKLSNRMLNKIQFKADEIVQLCEPDCLDIKSHEIELYFFTLKF